MGQGAYILGCAGLNLTAEETAFFAQANPWGFILFARNVESPKQLRALTDDLRSAVGREAPILIDQEGGRVQRMRAPHWREWLPPLDFCAAAGDNGERAMWLRYRLIAHELRAVGIDVNCSPMADVAQPDTHVFLKNRCYGYDADRVAQLARAAANGLLAGGVLPVIKHVPGHGRGALDSHLEVPRVQADRATLETTDFAPFRALSDLAIAMTSHVVYAAIDARPATVSPVIIDLIRKEIGFAGLLLTDDISMEALEGTVAVRSAKSLKAGCDVLLHCNGKLDEMRVVAAACGLMTLAAQSRADAALSARNLPEPIDIPGVETELLALLKGALPQDQAFV